MKAPDSNRDLLARAFLDASGWGNAAIAPLAGDASNRRYLRIAGQAGEAVLMDAPPERGEDTSPFVAVTEWLLDQGYSAPRILASDADEGFLLIEDLGDDLYARYLERHPEAEQELYETAVDLLVDCAGRDVPATIGRARLPLMPYDMDVLEREAMLLVEWWLPAATGTPVTDEIAGAYRALVRTAFAPVADAREVLVQRDYHAENLLWLPERDGLARVGLLDYQDALAGHPAYDLVSLLEDARRDTSLELQRAMVKRYLSARPELDARTFCRDYALLGAQRNLKIIGIFSRLCVRDRKPHYLDLIPRVWNHLTLDLSHPALSDMNDWIKQHVPMPDSTILKRIAAEARRA